MNENFVYSLLDAEIFFSVVCNSTSICVGSKNNGETTQELNSYNEAREFFEELPT